MARKKSDTLEPAVRIGRRCQACGIDFTLCHPSDPNLLCEKCRETLAEIIRERREIQANGNQDNVR